MRQKRTILACLLASWLIADLPDSWAGSAEDQFAVAAGEYSQGQWEWAVVEFQEFVETYPEHTRAVEARFYLGEALLQQGRFEDARVRYDDFLACRPEGEHVARARFRIGETSWLLNQDDKARLGFELFCEQHPDDPLNAYALVYFGQVLLRQEDWEKAKHALQESLDRYPNGPVAIEAQFSLGDVWRAAGEIEIARSHYERVAHDWPESPRAAESRLSLVTIDLEAGDIDSAREGIAELEEQFPKSHELADARRRLAKTLIHNEQYDSALETLTKILGELPVGAASEESASLAADPSVLYLLGLAHLGNHQAEATLNAIEPLLEEPLSESMGAAVDALRGAALVTLDRNEEAIEPLRSYLDRQADGINASKCRADLVIAYSQVGQFEAASELLHEMRSRDDDIHAFAVAALELAQAAQQEGNVPVATETYLLLMTDDVPSIFSSQARRELAWAQLDNGETEASARTFQAIVEGSNDDNEIAEAALAQGRLLEEAQQYNVALAAYNVVVERFDDMPQTPDALLGAARAHCALDQLEKAEAACARLVSQYPDWSEIDSALYRWAWVLSDLDRNDQAYAITLRIHHELPESRYWNDATYRLAERAYRSGEYEAAAELLDLLPDNKTDAAVLVYALYLQGQIESARGDWEQAMAAMTKLLETSPQHKLALSARYWQAEAAYRTEQFDQAEAWISQLRRDTVGQDEPWLGMLALREAQIFARQREWAEAISHAEAIAEQYPRFEKIEEVDYLIGRCFAAQGKFTAAREAYSRVIHSENGQRSETAAKAQWMIGESFFHQRNYREAIRAYHRIEHLYPYPQWQSAALLQSAKCYQAEGHQDEAISTFQEVMDRFGETSYALEAAQQLKTLREQTAQRP